MAAQLSLLALPGFPEVKPGDDLAGLIIQALCDLAFELQARDILVIAQKVVSKAENRFVDLAEVTPSARALELASSVRKDPRLVEVVLSQSEEILRYRPDVLVVAHRSGWVMANAGVDRSNLGPADGRDLVLLLPEDPDGSADAICRALEQCYGIELGVIISDSFGRAWRNGVVNVALGAAGLPALLDARGRRDRNGRVLEVTEIAVADALAASAALVMGEGDEGTPVVIARGFDWDAPEVPAAALIRPKLEDLFR